MSSTIVHNVRIFSGERVISSNGYILIENGLIKTVSDSTPTNLPKADVTINGEGRTVLPGLIDAHVHMHGGVPGLEQALKFGVTTVLDMFSIPELVKETQKICAADNGIADVKTACYGATVEGGWPAPVFRSTFSDVSVADELIKSWPKLEKPEDAEEFVKKNIADGADYIKLMQESGSAILGGPLPVPSPALQAALVRAAHAHGKIAVAHALSLEDTLIVLEAGVDGLAHCFADESPTDELVAAYRKNNCFLIPTLTIAATITGEELESSKEHVEHSLAEKVLDEEGKECYCKRMMLGREGCKVEYCYQAVRMLKEAGLDIVAGTDSAHGIPGIAFGLSLHHELSLYTSRCGFTPIEALRSATGTTARRFGMNDRGRLEEGLRADMLMVEGDPTSDIRSTMNVVGVWRGGQALSI